MNRHVRIAGTGSAVPARVVPNSELTDRCHSTDQWIRENLGIRERRIAAPDQLTSDLAAEAACRALALGYFDKGIISQVPSDILDDIRQEIPLRRLGRGEELFPLVRYLLSQESEYMTGQVLHLNGGYFL